jgi:hypothetical protein
MIVVTISVAEAFFDGQVARRLPNVQMKALGLRALSVCVLRHLAQGKGKGSAPNSNVAFSNTGIYGLKVEAASVPDVHGNPGSSQLSSNQEAASRRSRILCLGMKRKRASINLRTPSPTPSNAPLTLSTRILSRPERSPDFQKSTHINHHRQEPSPRC